MTVIYESFQIPVHTEVYPTLKTHGRKEKEWQKKQLHCIVRVYMEQKQQHCSLLSAKNPQQLSETRET